MVEGLGQLLVLAGQQSGSLLTEVGKDANADNADETHEDGPPEVGLLFLYAHLVYLVL